MAVRFSAVSIAIAALALTSCQSSGRYGTPATAAAAVGVGAAGAAASRAMGGCLAQCLPGQYCNTATGFCERPAEGATPLPAVATPAPPKKKHARRHADAAPQNASYAPGHEYEVPALGAGDAGCDPVVIEHADAGAVACEMDGGAT